jgi:hypothetical protein
VSVQSRGNTGYSVQRTVQRGADSMDPRLRDDDISVIQLSILLFFVYFVFFVVESLL